MLMNFSRSHLLIAAFGLLLGDSIPARAQEYDRVPWRTRRVSFTPQQRSVRDLFKDFATSQNLPLTLSDNVIGVTSGVFQNVESEKFLDLLCDAHDLVWFYDGVRMIIESTDEVLSRPLSLPFVTPMALSDVLFGVGYASGPKGREIQIKPGHRDGVLLLVGGPQFILATEALARDLDTQENRRINEQITVRTFRLNYASAGDITVNSGNNNRVIPGVVRSLQNLMANQTPGSSLSVGVEDTDNRVTRPSLRGSGLAAIGNPNAGTPVKPFNPYDPAGSQQPQQLAAAGGRLAADPNDPRSPMIVADSRLNAVLVRDVAARMPLYEELIKMLESIKEQRDEVQLEIESEELEKRQIEDQMRLMSMRLQEINETLHKK